MKYKGLGVGEACDEALRSLESLGGDGGVIAVDAKGKVAMRFNSEGMYRGFSDGTKVEVGLYKEMEK